MKNGIYMVEGHTIRPVIVLNNRVRLPGYSLNFGTEEFFEDNKVLEEIKFLNIEYLNVPLTDVDYLTTSFSILEELLQDSSMTLHYVVNKINEESRSIRLHIHDLNIKKPMKVRDGVSYVTEGMPGYRNIVTVNVNQLTESNDKHEGR